MLPIWFSLEIYAEERNNHRVSNHFVLQSVRKQLGEKPKFLPLIDKLKKRRFHCSQEEKTQQKLSNLYFLFFLSFFCVLAIVLIWYTYPVVWNFSSPQVLVQCHSFCYCYCCSSQWREEKNHSRPEYMHVAVHIFQSIHFMNHALFYVFGTGRQKN